MKPDSEGLHERRTNVLFLLDVDRVPGLQNLSLFHIYVFTDCKWVSVWVDVHRSDFSLHS